MAVLYAFGNGVLLGLLLTLMIGPVFFALIQTSIERGAFSGVCMAVGIALSDALYAIIAIFSVVLLANNVDFQAWLGLIGGLILLAFGISNVLKKIKSPASTQTLHYSNNILRQVGKGFLLNGINPFVLLIWFGVGVTVLKFNYSTLEKLAYFGGTLMTVFGTDILKVYASSQLRRWLTPAFMLRMNKLVGLALMLFSIKLFYFAYESFQL